MTCALYRHFDADGELLYVGISLSVMQRLSQHSSSPWSDKIARVEIEHLESREAALEAEGKAIASENPAFNIYRKAKPASVERQPGEEFDIAALKSAVASQIIDHIGLATLRAALQVKPDAIRKARRKEQMPAAWYHACEQLAGRPLPREAFSFKGARNDG